MSQSRYEYDENSETWPFFVLTGILVPLIPTTVSALLTSLSVSSLSPKTISATSIKKESSWFKPYNSKQLTKYKNSIQKSKLFTVKNFFILAGWALVILLTIKLQSIDVPVSETNFNPWSILGIDELADEKTIKGAYRKLSVKFHPDKVNKQLMNQTQIDEVDSIYVLINKAYKSLTDEAVKENFLKFGNPDGPADIKHGIALPKFLIDKGTNSLIFVTIYILLIAIILPFVVSNWWNGVKSYTKFGLHVKTAELFFDNLINYNPAKYYSVQTILSHLSHCQELQLIDRSLTPEKILDLLKCHINRTPLTNQKDELLQYKIVSIVPKLIVGYIDIASVFRNTEFVLKLVDCNRCVIQALNIESGSKANKFKDILQLPGVSVDTLDTELPIYTIGKLLKSPTEEPSKFLQTGSNTSELLKYASQIPIIEPIETSFKVPGESYIPTESTVFVSFKFLIKAYSHKSKPELTKLSKSVIDTQLNEIETIENLKNPLKIIEDQPALKLNTDCPPPYFPNPNYFQTSKNIGWLVLLSNQKDNKLIELPQFITNVDLSNLNLSLEEYLKSDAVVSTFKFQLSAPSPKEKGSYQFKLILRNLCYFGNDLEIPITMNVEDQEPEKHAGDDDVYGIEDPDEDSLAGALAQLRGESVKKIENEYESSDDEDDEDKELSDWSDIDTDTDVEE